MKTDLELDHFYFSDDSYLKEDLKNVNLKGLTGGKLLRSKLVQYMGEIFSLGEAEVVKLGRVVELVHNATLTHDDVIDNSHMRRDNPSIPALINNKKSVLLGDYMLARALHELSDFNNPKLTAELTLTLKDLVEGEWIQFENTNPYQITTTLYETLALKKTGSLFRWCFIAPYLASTPDHKLYDDLVKLGEEIGIIFQMTDDIIDFNSESKKTYGLDFRNNNLNYVLHFVGLNHPELTKKFLQLESMDELTETEKTYFDAAIKLAKDRMQKKVQLCRDIIARLSQSADGDTSSLSEIESLIDLLQTRLY
ncbi:MAG: hypothetical protein CME62_05175 [Halobacteriovoraceae bacterium]|nr:hypothetical protein [Halobacteriovoraceae bacterium]|tara:strand:+ start:10210 stop:11136 length:927 start_codon:yes stop_codon:yes gene_type:complete